MIEIYPCGNLEETVKELIRLRNDGIDAFCTFNNHRLYSKNVTLDSAYIEVCGYTYKEYEEQRKEMLKNGKKKEWPKKKTKVKLQNGLQEDIY